MVADEVRKLAERTAKGHRRDHRHGGSDPEGTRLAVETMNEGVARVEGGVELAGQAGASMEQIRAGATQVVDAVTDISAALREQGCGETTRSPAASNTSPRWPSRTRRRCVTPHNTAQRLEGLAQHLRDEVAHFHI